MIDQSTTARSKSATPRATVTDRSSDKAEWEAHLYDFLERLSEISFEILQIFESYRDSDCESTLRGMNKRQRGV